MNKKVLIFDDDQDILHICAIVLKNKGYDVHTESSCANVIEKVKNYQPDAILMDNWIPDTGGIAATQKIKGVEETQHIPVIFFSANAHVSSLAQQASADYFLQKPFDIRDLENIVTTSIKNVEENSIGT